jgi:hypothetical protein
MPAVTASPSQIEVILNQVSAVCQLVNNIAVVSPLTPRGTWKFPAIILNVGAAQYVGSSSQDVITRDIAMTLLVGEAASDLQLQREGATLPLIDALHQQFLRRRDLNGYALKASVTRDSGAQTIVLGDKSYIGCLLNLQVIYAVMQIG